MINLEIDGQPLSVDQGTSIIEAAESIGVYIPRYCYHKKLSIAANCRMCLVEVEKVGKPLPACATPVTQDMKVWTRSEKTIAAQRDVLEFLLINHPLDCPVCDQGGVCELQDFSIGYGKGRSHFDEQKLSVSKENIGPLVETWMTRCIKCTRCVRFGEEIAGMRELGVINRGEKSEIITYLKTFVDSELSANITDICPVGALTAKPSRYKARNWELHESAGIAPHDCVGSNIYFHTQGHAHHPEREVVNVVPRENEEVNETWISDRDRFSYLGLQHEDRCLSPMLKQNGQWKKVTWQRVLPEIVDRLTAILQNQGADQLAFLSSPNATTEEMYLLQKLARALGCHNVDHRLRQQDINVHEVMPEQALGVRLSDIENCDQIVLVGSNVRLEQPLVAHRIRQAALDMATVSTINPKRFDCYFEVKAEDITDDIVLSLAKLSKALGLQEESLSTVQPDAFHSSLAKDLLASEQPLILLGLYAAEHPYAMTIKALAERIEAQTAIKVGWLTAGANTAGAWRAGMVPHRNAGGEKVNAPGLSAYHALGESPVRAYLLLQLEAESDVANPAAALGALDQAGLVICLSAFASEKMKAVADFILPIAPFMQNMGSFTNVAGDEQVFTAASVPHGHAKPAWKIIRAIANYFQLEGFSYSNIESLRNELKALDYNCGSDLLPLALPEKSAGLQRYAGVPIYDTDALVRRSSPLQQSNLTALARVTVHSETASRLQLKEGMPIVVQQGDSQVSLPLAIDDRIAENVVVVPAGCNATAGFGQGHGPVVIKEKSC